MDSTHNITIEHSVLLWRWACDCGSVGHWLSTKGRAQELGEFHVTRKKEKE